MTLFRRSACVLALGAVLLFNARTAQADVVLDWDVIAIRTLTTQSPALNPFAQARFAAIVQLAVFEAVNAINGDYEGYLGSAAAGGNTISVIPGSSPEAAAISAAYTVLSTFFPASAAALTADYNASLATIPAGPAKTNGIAAGQAAAAALMALRVGDGSAPLTNYLPGAGLDAGEWDITPGCPTTPGAAYSSAAPSSTGEM